MLFHPARPLWRDHSRAAYGLSTIRLSDDGQLMFLAKEGAESPSGKVVIHAGAGEREEERMP